MFTNESPWYKNKVILGIIVIVAVILGAMLFGPSGGGDRAGDVRSGETEVIGKFACMPYKPGNQALEQNCVLGLEASDGNFYAIDTSGVEDPDSDLDPSSELRLVGTLVPVNPDSDEAKIFDYDGVLMVRLLTKNE